MREAAVFGSFFCYSLAFQVYKEYIVKNLYKLLFIILAAAGLLWLILYGPGQMRDIDTYEYSEDYVQTKELPGMLEFCYFSADEWEEKMAEEEFGQIVTP